MKFNNGCWLQQEGCAFFSPQQAYFTKIETDKVTICAPTTPINQRGDTLDGINLTLVVTAPMDEVIRVQVFHHLGAVSTYPAFEIQADARPVLTDEDEERIIIHSGSLALEIGKNPWYMRYTRNGRPVTQSAGNDLALVKTNWKGIAYDRGDNTNTYMRQQLALGVDEKIYGLGERFTPLVRNGQSVKIWNADGGTSTEQC